MKILVAYATNSSGTLVASRIVAEKLAYYRHTVTHSDIRVVEPTHLGEYDLIVFGSPSWNYKKLEGMPHEFFRAFIQKAIGQKFPEKKFAVFGLGDTAYILFCGAVDRLESFVTSLEGKLIVPSLRIDGFYFDQSSNEARVAHWADELAKVIENELNTTEEIRKNPQVPIDQV